MGKKMVLVDTMCMLVCGCVFAFDLGNGVGHVPMVKILKALSEERVISAGGILK